MPEPFERFINRSDELDDYRLLRIADILARAESLDFDVAGLADAIERMLDCGRFRDDTTLQDVSMFQQFGEGAARAPEASLRPPSPPIRPSSAQSAASRTTQAEPRTCVICISEEPVAAALPCGHLILCEGCREEGAIGCGDSCPLCRRRVDGVFRIWV
ncbi:hypothetical protein DFJ74DRAFT_682872 [Hyaloraphidium curvatum]|nr:hypothetical protein DFJ74DRAFT_682872 [Hyaloraphidium curvatum]